MITNLPKSDDEFFKDAEVELVNIPTQVYREVKHVLAWDGPYAVCTSCDYSHTIPVDPKKYDIKDGSLVKKNLTDSKQ